MAPYLWMLLAAASFATMNALGRAASERGADWRLVALARVGLMLVFAFVIARAGRVRLAFLRPPALWMRSLAGSAALLSTFYAVTHLPLSDAVTLMNTVPVWVTLLSWPLLGERPGLQEAAAVGVSMLGVVLIAQPHFREGNLAILVALANAAFTAVAVLGLHRLGGVDPRAVVVHFSAVATAVGGAVLSLSGLAPHLPVLRNAHAMTLLVGVALVGTVGQIGLTRAFALGVPARVSVVGLTQLLFAVGYDVFLWRRTLNAWAAAGMVLVAAPTAWLLLRRALRRDRAGGNEETVKRDELSDVP
jgi:drug/metabolite transporter (DMT)-like permease